MYGMSIHFEIDPAAIQALARAAHPPFECPFCTEWRTCATCSNVETLALNWHAHVIAQHWEEIEAASAAALAEPDNGVMRYYKARLTQICEEREAKAAAAAAEQETADAGACCGPAETETANASGD